MELVKYFCFTVWNCYLVCLMLPLLCWSVKTCFCARKSNEEAEEQWERSIKQLGRRKIISERPAWKKANNASFCVRKSLENWISTRTFKSQWEQESIHTFLYVKEHHVNLLDFDIFSVRKGTPQIRGFAYFLHIKELCAILSGVPLCKGTPL